MEDREGHRGWYSNPAGAATSKATVYKEGVGKYMPSDAPPPSDKKSKAGLRGGQGGGGERLKKRGEKYIASHPPPPSDKESKAGGEGHGGVLVAGEADKGKATLLLI